MALTAVWSLLILLCAFYAHSLYSNKQRRKGLRLPPGPKGYPILGKTLEAIDPSTKPWQKFAKWKEETGAGHLMTVPTLGQTNIFITNAQVAVDLFEKRGPIYSGRPPSVFTNELVNKEMLLVTNNDPEKVKRLRKLLHEQFSHSGAELFQEAQLEEATNLVKELLNSPTGSDECFTKSMQRLVLRTTYGTAVSFTPEELWTYVAYSGDRPEPPIAPIMSAFPILKYWPRWLPGGGFHALADEYYEEDKKVWEKVRDDVKAGMESGKTQSCILSRMYATDAPQRLGFSELDMAFVAANLFTAGGDLPEITLRIFTAAMLHFPEVLKRAQQEIDRVIGRDRKPSFEDKNDLPYTRAVILETQRWRPLAPIGVAHTATQDDVYSGYFIPKNAVVFPNLHAMSLDPEVYPEPTKFKPERFLSPEGNLNRKHELASFGYGRRLCSAMHFAEATLFIDIATLIWAFDIEAPLDSDGQRILPDVDMDNWNGILPCRPLPFASNFVARDANIPRVLAMDLE